MDNVYSPRIAETDGVPLDAASYHQQHQKMPSKVAQTPTMKANSSTLPPRPSGADGDNTKTTPNKNDKGTNPEEQIDHFLRQMFGSCGGMVSDAAVFLYQATCKGQDGKDDLQGNHGMDQQQYLRMANRRRAYATPGGLRGRRQGETLEFPTQGGFDDDVSALSAHTLEEMERNNVIARAMKSKFPPTMSLGRVWGNSPPPRNGTVATAASPAPHHRQRGTFGGSGFGGPSSEQPPIISPPATTTSSTPPTPSSNLPWTYQVVGLARQTSEESQSIGVSTSGSSDGDQPEHKPSATNPTTQAEVTYTRVVV